MCVSTMVTKTCVFHFFCLFKTPSVLMIKPFESKIRKIFRLFTIPSSHCRIHVFIVFQKRSQLFQAQATTILAQTSIFSRSALFYDISYRQRLYISQGQTLVSGTSLKSETIATSEITAFKAAISFDTGANLGLTRQGFRLEPKRVCITSSSIDHHSHCVPPHIQICTTAPQGFNKTQSRALFIPTTIKNSLIRGLTAYSQRKAKYCIPC